MPEISCQSQQAHDAQPLLTDSLPEEPDSTPKSLQHVGRRQKEREKDLNLNKKFCRLSGADNEALGQAIGIPVEDIVELSWCQLKAKMNEMNLSEEQREICRDIRRRGRNKVRRILLCTAGISIEGTSSSVCTLWCVVIVISTGCCSHLPPEKDRSLLPSQEGDRGDSGKEGQDAEGKGDAADGEGGVGGGFGRDAQRDRHASLLHQQCHVYRFLVLIERMYVYCPFKFSATLCDKCINLYPSLKAPFTLEGFLCKFYAMSWSKNNCLMQAVISCVIKIV